MRGLWKREREGGDEWVGGPAIAASDEEQGKLECGAAMSRGGRRKA